MSDEPPWVPPPMTPFSARSERRALYRALLRTAVLAAVLLFAGGLVFNLVGALAGRARLGGDALDRFEQALVVAHPDLVLNGSGRGTESYRWRLTSTNTFQYLEAGQTKEADVRLTRSFGGGADASYPETALTRASHRGRLDQAATRRFIAGLPDAAATDAIVELRQPVSSPRVLLDRWGVVQNCRAGYVEPPFAGRARALSPRAASGDPSPLRDATVSWHCLDPGGFSSWADSLAARDDAVLSALRLPTRPVLRSLSQDGMVYGFYLQSLAKAQLQSLLADPQVAAVTPVVSALAVPVGAFAP